jgi:arylsulfatase A-like enzyme
MSRFQPWAFVLMVGALMMGTVCRGKSQAAEARPSRPNVILIITDDQGYGDLHCNGNPLIKTPNLDRLAQESVRLTDFHVDPTCSPTRAALMTGRYSCRTGVWHTIMGRSLLRRDEVTMAQLFRQAGYRTAIFGKWHLGDSFPYRPWDRGFEECLIHLGGGIGQGPDYWGNTYFSPTLCHNGSWEKHEGYCTDIFFREALKFITSHRDEPFFVYLPTNAPHAPLQVEERYAQPYREAGLPDNLARFYGMITNIDENVGRLLESLKQLHLEEKTILVFMTDNGTAGGGFNAGMRGKKGSMYEGGHRVPCFIRWPGKLTPKEVPGLTAHLDLLPTLMDFCGVPLPKDLKLDGITLRPYLETEQPVPERTLVVQVNRVDHPRPWAASAVLEGPWRLIDGKELYDLRSDPGQQHDVASEHPEKVAELRGAYERWYADVSQRFGEYCELVLGAPEQNPVILCSHDWHGNIVPWDQSQMQRGLKGQGFWAVEFARPGRYRFELRDRPPYVSFKLPKGRARLVVEGLLDAEKPIPPDAEGVVFEADLPAGKSKLEARHVGEDGSWRGFYFVVVTRVEP